MKFSDRQIELLQLLHQAGGRGTMKGTLLVTEHWRTSSSLSLLHLVAKGALAGANGYIKITDYGYRVINVTPPAERSASGIAVSNADL